MMNRLYSRQEPLGLMVPESAAIIGSGGTGTWVAIFLAMSGVRMLEIMEEDILEYSNLNRLPYPPEATGKPKAEVLQALLESLRPDISIDAYPFASRRTLELLGSKYVFDCTDRYSTQVMISRWCRENERTYVRVGYDGIHLTVSGTVPEWGDDGDEAGYTIQPSWVVPAVVAAAIGVTKVMYYPEIEVSHNVFEIYKRRGET